MTRFLATAAAVAVLVTGCGADAPDVGSQTGDGADAVELGSRDDTGPAPAGVETDRPDGTDGTSEPDEDAPEPDATQETDPTEESEQPGVETIEVNDAGEVEVRVDGGRVELVDVRPADGWRHTLDDDEDSEIELEFRHDDGRTIDVEITLEGGRVQTEID